MSTGRESGGAQSGGGRGAYFFSRSLLKVCILLYMIFCVFFSPPIFFSPSISITHRTNRSPPTTPSTPTTPATPTPGSGGGGVLASLHHSSLYPSLSVPHPIPFVYPRINSTPTLSQPPPPKQAPTVGYRWTPLSDSRGWTLNRAVIPIIVLLFLAFIQGALVRASVWRPGGGGGAYYSGVGNTLGGGCLIE